MNTALQTNTHTVERGETLYSIAWHYGLDWRRLARWNEIEAPYTIYPGQRLSLSRQPRREPATDSRTATADSASELDTEPDTSQGEQASPESATAQTRPDAGKTDGVTVTPLPPSPPPETSGSTEANKTTETAAATDPPTADRSDDRETAADERRWHWPVDGELADSYGSSDSRDGIDIAGEPGTLVHATKGGNVVYSGSGLKGYGKLVIIKHDQHYLSAYGYNRRLLVEEGTQVAAGDKIAEMGVGPRQKPMLHFEIRHNGQPQDPAEILPPR